MSFQIHLGLRQASRADAEGVARSLEGVAPLAVLYDKRVKILGYPSVAIAETGQGALANTLLSDDADWNAQHWSLRPELLSALNETVTKVFAESHQGIAFAASWIGERPAKTIAVTLTDLADAILHNRVPNGTVIEVQKSRTEQSSG